ncbi:MAG: hypothetical protein R3286_18925 [Gammaproteobacteria bacterium]|nr:hypothetical protein [Gammaproteobacteria bacterium]
MSLPFVIYTVCWLVACLIAIGVAIGTRRRCELLGRAYWRFLSKPWRVATFVVAATCLVVVAPYTGDIMWDYVDATFMSVLTFATAPWATGTAYRFIRGWSRLGNLYIALCVWMLSASWAYDLYIYFRDGHYPVTWFANLFASSVLYVSAGLFWNLDHREGRGVVFAFMESDWFSQSEASSFWKIAAYAAPFMAIVAATIVYFLVTP